MSREEVSCVLELAGGHVAPGRPFTGQNDQGIGTSIARTSPNDPDELPECRRGVHLAGAMCRCCPAMGLASGRNRLNPKGER